MWANSVWGFIGFAVAFILARISMIWTPGHEEWGPRFETAALLCIAISVAILFAPLLRRPPRIAAWGIMASYVALSGFSIWYYFCQRQRTLAMAASALTSEKSVSSTARSYTGDVSPDLRLLISAMMSSSVRGKELRVMAEQTPETDVHWNDNWICRTLGDEITKAAKKKKIIIEFRHPNEITFKPVPEDAWQVAKISAGFSGTHGVWAKIIPDAEPFNRKGMPPPGSMPADHARISEYTNHDSLRVADEKSVLQLWPMAD
jgi:hypothetical protein